MEDKVSIREIAEESGATHAEVIAKAADLSIILKSPQTKLTYEQAEEIVNYIVTGRSDKIKIQTKPKTIIQKTQVDVVNKTTLSQRPGIRKVPKINITKDTITLSSNDSTNQRKTLLNFRTKFNNKNTKETFVLNN